MGDRRSFGWSSVSLDIFALRLFHTFVPNRGAGLFSVARVAIGTRTPDASAVAVSDDTSGARSRVSLRVNPTRPERGRNRGRETALVLRRGPTGSWGELNLWWSDSGLGEYRLDLAYRSVETSFHQGGNRKNVRLRRFAYLVEEWTLIDVLGLSNMAA